MSVMDDFERHLQIVERCIHDIDAADKLKDARIAQLESDLLAAVKSRDEWKANAEQWRDEGDKDTHEAWEALRLIHLATTYSDISDGEGTAPDDIFEGVKKMCASRDEWRECARGLAGELSGWLASDYPSTYLKSSDTIKRFNELEKGEK